MPDREQILEIMDRASGGQYPPEPTDGELAAFRAGYYEGLADGLRSTAKSPAGPSSTSRSAAPARSSPGWGQGVS